MITISTLKFSLSGNVAFHLDCVSAEKRNFARPDRSAHQPALIDPFLAAGGPKNAAAPDKTHVLDVTDGELESSFIVVVDPLTADAIRIQQFLP